MDSEAVCAQPFGEMLFFGLPFRKTEAAENGILFIDDRCIGGKDEIGKPSHGGQRLHLRVPAENVLQVHPLPRCQTIVCRMDLAFHPRVYDVLHSEVNRRAHQKKKLTHPLSFVRSLSPSPAPQTSPPRPSLTRSGL